MTFTATIRGGDSLVRDVLTHLCQQAEIDVRDEETDVAVLADPTADDWVDVHDTGAPIVLVATHPLDGEALASAVAKGANAVVHTGSDAGELRHAVAVTASGGAYFDGMTAAALVGVVRRDAAGAKSQPLTTREQQILRSIERGESVKQTARALGIAPKTVENLQSRLFAKLQVRNRAQAMRQAYSLGLLDG